MSGNNLKRSVATLGVVAGLLAAAVAASAGTQVGSEGVKDDVPLETVSFTFKGEVTGLEPT